MPGENRFEHISGLAWASIQGSKTPAQGYKGVWENECQGEQIGIEVKGKRPLESLFRLFDFPAIK